MEQGGARRSNGADIGVSKPRRGGSALLDVDVPRAHRAGAEPQPVRGIVTQTAGEGFVRIEIVLVDSAVLHGQHVIEFSEVAVHFEAVIYAPNITEGMRDEWIVDGIARLVFLAKGNIETTHPDV